MITDSLFFVQHIKIRVVATFFVLFLVGFTLSPNLYAYDNQVSLWVGQSYNLEITDYYMLYNQRWSASPGITLSGGNYTKKATINNYFKGTGYVTYSYSYQLYYGDNLKNATKTWYITCKDNPVSISHTNITLDECEEATIGFKLTYDNKYSAFAKVTYDGYTPSIISVKNTTSTIIAGSYNMTGVITALSPGTSYLYLHTSISANSPYCIVTVTEKKIEPTSVSLSTSETIEMGENITLKPTLIPENATTTFSWTVDKEYVATISSSGLVTGISPGTAAIQVTTSNNLTSTCYVTVSDLGSDTTSKIEKAKARIAWLREKSEVNIDAMHNLN